MGDGVGDNSGRFLKWGGGSWGLIKESPLKHIKKGVGVLKELPPLPLPPENFSRTRGYKVSKTGKIRYSTFKFDISCASFPIYWRLF